MTEREWAASNRNDRNCRLLIYFYLHFPSPRFNAAGCTALLPLEVISPPPATCALSPWPTWPSLAVTAACWVGVWESGMCGHPRAQRMAFRACESRIPEGGEKKARPRQHVEGGGQGPRWLGRAGESSVQNARSVGSTQCCRCSSHPWIGHGCLEMLWSVRKHVEGSGPWARCP